MHGVGRVKMNRITVIDIMNFTLYYVKCVQVINISLLPRPNNYFDDTPMISPTPKYTDPKNKQRSKQKGENPFTFS